MDFVFRGEAIRRDGFTKWSTSDPAAMSEGIWLFGGHSQLNVNFLIYVDVDEDVEVSILWIALFVIAPIMAFIIFVIIVIYVLYKLFKKNGEKEIKETFKAHNSS